MGIMLVYDITNEKSFDNIKNWIRNIEEHASADVEKMILGNKCDMNDKRQVLQILLHILHLPFFCFQWPRYQKTEENNLLLNMVSNSWKQVQKHPSMLKRPSSHLPGTLKQKWKRNW